MMGFTPVGSTLGGLVLGVAISLLILFDGRIAGISGNRRGGASGARGAELSWRLSLSGELVGGGLLWRLVSPGVFGAASSAGLVTMAIGGFLVGVGTTLGNGCTSGHGLCGISRLSPRSIVATLVFVATGNPHRHRDARPTVSNGTKKNALAAICGSSLRPRARPRRDDQSAQSAGIPRRAREVGSQPDVRDGRGNRRGVLDLSRRQAARSSVLGRRLRLAAFYPHRRPAPGGRGDLRRRLGAHRVLPGPGSGGPRRRAYRSRRGGVIDGARHACDASCDRPQRADHVGGGRA